MTFGELRLELQKLYPGLDPDTLDGYINEAYEQIARRRRWKGVEAESQFVTVAVYRTGTIALTANATTVTGTDTVFTSAMTGRKIRPSGRNESYTFTYVSATSGTLDRGYEGETATELAYDIYQNRYDLASGFREPMIAVNELLNGEIVHISRERMDRIAPARVGIGEPQVYCVVGTTQAELYPIPEYARSHPYRYYKHLARLTDGDTAVAIPDWIWISTLKSGVRALAGKDRGEQAKFEADLVRMQVEDANRAGPKHLRIHPRYIARAYESRPIDRRSLL